MKNFEYYNPVKLIFGKGQLKKLRPNISNYKKIMLLYGGGSIKKNGLYESIINELNGLNFIEFSGIEPNPRYETAMKAVEVVNREGVDFILAVGGGSVIDAAKFIAVASKYKDGDPWDILSKNKPVTDALSIGVILTLPATGSEMNMAAVITREATKEKYAFLSPFSFPKFSILLPEVAASLPKHQIANGIVDAFVHVVEQYLTYNLNTPLQDRFAESILITLIEEGPKVYHNPNDYDSMANLMLCANMALNGVISCGVATDWSVHSIGHEITALYEIDHARTLAIVLPGIWKALREEKKEKLIQYAERVWGISRGDDHIKINNAIFATVDFFESLGVKTRLSEYNLGCETISEIIKRFEERNWKALGDRQLVTLDVVKKALEYQL